MEQKGPDRDATAGEPGGDGRAGCGAGWRVQPASAADARRLVPLVRRYWDFERIMGFDEARVLSALEGQLSNPGVARAWMALTDDTPVGYLLTVYVLSLEHLGLTAEIDELYVVPELRGGGVGTALLRAAEAGAVAAGCTSVSLRLGAGNERGRAFYRAKGYGHRAGYDLLEKALPTPRE